MTWRSGEGRAAFWRKHRIGELDVADAQVLTREFEADYYGTADEDARFTVVALTPGILDDGAAGVCARFRLRAYDAVQLASALAVRAVDPAVATMAVFDTALRAAAVSTHLVVLPGVSRGGRAGGR